MTLVVLGAVGLALGGPVLALCLISVAACRLLVRRSPATRPIRPLLMVLIVELRSGRSTLGALQEAARVFPEDQQLVRASRVASVSGLTAALDGCGGPIRGVLAQLARAQRSGSPVAETVRSLLDADIAAERARRIEKARTLPIRLMVPITLLVMPGLVLLLYAPSLLRTFADLSGPLS